VSCVLADGSLPGAGCEATAHADPPVVVPRSRSGLAGCCVIAKSGHDVRSGCCGPLMRLSGDDLEDLDDA